MDKKDIYLLSKKLADGLASEEEISIFHELINEWNKNYIMYRPILPSDEQVNDNLP